MAEFVSIRKVHVSHPVIKAAKHSTLTVPLSTQVYEWLPENLILGVTLPCISSIPSKR